MSYTDEYFESLLHFNNDPEVLARFMRLAGLKVNDITLMRLMGSCDFSLRTLLATSFSSLKQEVELGDSGAAFLKFLQVLILRFQKAKLENRDVISNVSDLYQYLIMKMSSLADEQVLLLLLDAKNHLISDCRIATGVSNDVIIYPRQILKKAIENSASAFIIVHNHPSGDTTPSALDITTSLELQHLCEKLDITFHDHIIVGRDRITSMRTSGLLTATSIPPSQQRHPQRELQCL